MPASKRGKLRPHRIDYIVLAEVEPGNKAPLHSVLLRTVTSKEAREQVLEAHRGSILIVGSNRFYGKLSKRKVMHKLTPTQVKKAKEIILSQIFTAGPALGTVNADGTVAPVTSSSSTVTYTGVTSITTSSTNDVAPTPISASVDNVGGVLEVGCDCEQCAPPSDTTEPYVRQPGDPEATTPEYDTDYNPYTAPEGETMEQYMAEANEEAKHSTQMLGGVMIAGIVILVTVGGFICYHFGWLSRLFHK